MKSLLRTSEPFIYSFKHVATVTACSFIVILLLPYRLVMTSCLGTLEENTSNQLGLSAGLLTPLTLLRLLVISLRWADLP